MAGMQASARDKTARVFFDVIGNVLVHAVGESDDFRSHVVDENSAIDASGIEVVEKGFGGATEFGNLVKVRALPLHEFQSVRLEHFERLDVDVAVGDQGLFSVLGSWRLPGLDFQGLKPGCFVWLVAGRMKLAPP